MYETYDGEVILEDYPATGPRLGIIGGGQRARIFLLVNYMDDRPEDL